MKFGVSSAECVLKCTRWNEGGTITEVFCTTITGIGINEKKQLIQVAFWYSVGESNPYCKIENLEY